MRRFSRSSSVMSVRSRSRAASAWSADARRETSPWRVHHRTVETGSLAGEE